VNDPQPEHTLIERPVLDNLSPDFTRCYEEVKTWVSGGGRMSTFEIIDISTRVINLVEKTKNVNGIQKKFLVMNLLRYLVSQQEYTDEGDKESILNFINKELPVMIDVFIGIARGRVDLGKNISLLRRLCCK
jgi:hypothetical protein